MARALLNDELMDQLIRKPSRILNENSVLMGLNFSDLIALAILLMIFQLCLKPFGLEFFALISTGIAMVVLSSIRMNFRRKILRDTAAFLLKPKAILIHPKEKQPSRQI